MPLQHVVGVDHVVVTVRDLDRAAQAWRDIGFTVSPRGTHSEHMGTANYTIMLEDDYIELLGVLHPTDNNDETRKFLERREGLERTAFTATDAQAGADELRTRGFEPIGPVHFSRPVTMPDGTQSAAKFNVFRWPNAERPGGMRIFACQHLTRASVWVPDLLHQPNGAKRLVQIEVASADAAAAAAHMARLIDQPARQEGGIWRVPSGKGRADFVFYDAAGMAQRYSPAARAGGASEGCVALVLATSDLAAVSKRPHAIEEGGKVIIPAAHTAGVLLAFVPA